MFDFRDGLLQEKAVYKDTSCDWKSVFLYIGCMLICYIWAFAWWNLFYYLYGNFQKIVFWVWIGVFLLHFIILITIGIINIKSGRNKKKKARKEEDFKKEQLKRIQTRKQIRMNNNKPKETEQNKEPEGGLIENNDYEMNTNGRYNTELQTLN